MENTGGLIKKKRKNFSMVSNVALTDKRLSLGAKGLYALIESLLSIEGFQLYRDYLLTLSTNGRDATQKCWNELKKFGYLKQTRISTSKGFIYEYELLDTPNDEPTHGNPVGGKPVDENSVTGESNNGKADDKNNKLEKNIIENNTIDNNNVVADIKTKLNEKISLEKQITKEAYRLGESFYNEPDDKFSKLISLLKQSEINEFLNINEHEIWEVYQMFLILFDYLPDFFDEKPKVQKSKEAYIIGVIKNKIVISTD